MSLNVRVRLTKIVVPKSVIELFVKGDVAKMSGTYDILKLKNPIGTILGIRIIENPYLIITENKQKKTCKIKWINFILSKLFGFETITKPDPNVYQFSDRIIAHPEVIKQIKAKLEETK
jgi:hypothetical protein